MATVIWEKEKGWDRWFIRDLPNGRISYVVIRITKTESSFKYDRFYVQADNKTEFYEKLKELSVGADKLLLLSPSRHKYRYEQDAEAGTTLYSPWDNELHGGVGGYPD